MPRMTHDDTDLELPFALWISNCTTIDNPGPLEINYSGYGSESGNSAPK